MACGPAAYPHRFRRASARALARFLEPLGGHGACRQDASGSTRSPLARLPRLSLGLAVPRQESPPDRGSSVICYGNLLPKHAGHRCLRSLANQSNQRAIRQRKRPKVVGHQSPPDRLAVQAQDINPAIVSGRSGDTPVRDVPDSLRRSRQPTIGPQQPHTILPPSVPVWSSSNPNRTL